MKLHNNKKTILGSCILLAWAVLCTFIVCIYLDIKKADAAIVIWPTPSTATTTDANYDIALLAATPQTGCITYGTVGVYFRETPGGNQIKVNGTPIQLNGGHPLEILDTSNASWYKVRLTYNGTSYTGYVASQYVYISSSSAISDADFEKMISGFPESYKPQLRELHKKHPTWIFNPVNTGLDWSTVVANEVNTSKEVKNLVQGTSSYPRYNWRSTTVGFDYATDKYKSYDATTWFAASDALVTYYLDPRVYLSERYVFAFETLTYDASQTRQGVEAILYGSFMQGSNRPSTDPTYTYAELIVKAGAAAGVSPYHLASRIRQEVGTTNGVVTNGRDSNYPGIYNFYNIGAFDSSGGGATTKALQWASSGTTYGRPWNTVYKSIYGGALYIGEQYIFKGQNTLYTQKFNVTNKSSLYSHQYMTNVQAVSTEADKVYTAYSGANMLDNAIVFSIPVYNNMPSAISTMPADSGSPNNWLKTLTVSGYSFNFNPATTSYSLSVKENVSSITVAATTVNARATVAGTGTISLSSGTNTINIVVTAQNGSKRTYTLNVTRAGSTTSISNATLTLGTNSYVYDGTAKKPSVKVTLGSKTLTNGTDYTVAYSNNINVGTATVTVTGKGNYSGTISKTFTITSPSSGGEANEHLGDLNGDGKITAIDIVYLQRLITGLDKITDESLALGDINKDGKISAVDIVYIQRHITGLQSIN